MIKAKFQCKNCLVPDTIGHLMRRQCAFHLNGIGPRMNYTVFDDSHIKCGQEQILTHLLCHVCKKLPKSPRVCSHCRKCTLCLQCARNNLIRFNQCPECCHAKP